MSDTPLGRFCWYELITTDPSAAPDFYGAVAGWGTAPYEGADQPYTMWMNGEGPIGGVMDLTEEAKAGGAPPHWLAHISTPDLAATKAKAAELGGQILMEMSVPEVGDFAMVRDPQGAVFSAYQPSGETPGHDNPPAVGEFGWNELTTDNWEAAWSFYSELFGWQKTDAMDMGELGTYQMYGRGAHPIGGMSNRPPDFPASAWLYYIEVPDINTAVDKVKELGGTVLDGPMEVPGESMVAHCRDPQGAAFAIHGPAPAKA